MFANSVKRTCAAVCPLYGDVPMGAPGPPGQKGPPGPPVSFTLWVFTVQDISVYTLGTFTIKKKEKKFAHVLCRPLA